MSIHVFGIRHHGPGCARSLRAALEALAPDVLLIEGPPDAADVLPLAADPAMRPPVALLVYPPEAPRSAVFYPFAEFSPEWQALRFGLGRGIPVRFMDLPIALRLSAPPEGEGGGDGEDPSSPSFDAIGRLAGAAGFEDQELWWEQEVERRRDPAGLFDGIREAMQALRAEAPPLVPFEARREAHMRQTIRAAVKEGRERIAVVCGAWHAPALASPGPARPDAEILKGPGRTKVVATWVPWTYGRLSFRSGYGAGVASPGWYQHLWTNPDRAVVRWATEAARLLRSEDIPAPSAGVIELVRLADALAAMRGLRDPGLAEIDESMVAVLCAGDATPLALVRERLEIGDRLGEVPASAPTVPLRRDLTALQRSLRLKPSPESRPLDLDLRKDIDRERSRLFHRLVLLEVPWGERRITTGKAGTFHEIWELCWRPELEPSLVAASLWGNTVDEAAGARLRRLADETPELPRLTELLDVAILCEVPDAVEHLLRRVEQVAAVGAHVLELLHALPPLARVVRYGDVRATPREHVAAVIDGLLARVLVGLPGACASLDDEAADRMSEGLAGVTGSLLLLEREAERAAWVGLLDRLALMEGIHGLVRGHACRLLLEQKALATEELGRRSSLALSAAVPPAEAAAWLEGLLRGKGLLLLQEKGLWTALDDWTASLPGETFDATLPLVRRAFSGFSSPERRAMGEKVRTLGRGPGGGAAARGTAAPAAEPLDEARAARVLPVLARILGANP